MSLSSTLDHCTEHDNSVGLSPRPSLESHQCERSCYRTIDGTFKRNRTELYKNQKKIPEMSIMIISMNKIVTGKSVNIIGRIRKNRSHKDGGSMRKKEQKRSYTCRYLCNAIDNPSVCDMMLRFHTLRSTLFRAT